MTSLLTGDQGIWNAGQAASPARISGLWSSTEPGMEVQAMTMTENRDLVEAARLGSAAAFERLVEQYFGMVFTIAYSRCGSRETAEDLAQETLLRAWLCMDHLKDPRCFAPWITQIARSIAGEWLRKGGRRSRLATMVPLADLPHEEIPDHAAQGAREMLENAERERSLWAAVKQLPESEREVVLLHYSEGLSKAEIASRLGTHPATVGRQIDRALKMLRSSLDPLLHTLAPSARPQQKAIVRTSALIAAATALTAPTRTSLAATATAELAKVGALSTPALPSASTGFSALLKTISASVWTGGKVMGMAKTVGILAVGGAVATGGVFYYSEHNSAAESDAGSEAFLSPQQMREMRDKYFPKDVRETLKRQHEELKALRNPAKGDNLTATLAYAVDEQGRVWGEGMSSFRNPGTPISGEITANVSGMESSSLQFFNEKDEPLKTRDAGNSDVGGEKVHNYAVTLDRTWGSGEERDLYSFGTGARLKEINGKYVFEHGGRQQGTFPVWMQECVFLPKESPFEFVDSEDKTPPLIIAKQDGSYRLVIWRHRRNPGDGVHAKWTFAKKQIQRPEQ